jgi:hypothetical protein
MDGLWRAGFMETMSLYRERSPQTGFMELLSVSTLEGLLERFFKGNAPDFYSGRPLWGTGRKWQGRQWPNL